ncbi:hypothetical protein ACLOJK_027574, partial [Asimina triloba]
AGGGGENLVKLLVSQDFGLKSSPGCFSLLHSLVFSMGLAEKAQKQASKNEPRDKKS